MRPGSVRVNPLLGAKFHRGILKSAALDLIGSDWNGAGTTRPWPRWLSRSVTRGRRSNGADHGTVSSSTTQALAARFRRAGLYRDADGGAGSERAGSRLRLGAAKLISYRQCDGRAAGAIG